MAGVIIQGVRANYTINLVAASIEFSFIAEQF